jgi:hypothetical protein
MTPLGIGVFSSRVIEPSQPGRKRVRRGLVIELRPGTDVGQVIDDGLFAHAQLLTDVPIRQPPATRKLTASACLVMPYGIF